MPYDSNLSLPLCPRCLDTKEVSQNYVHNTKMSYCTFISYTCHTCRFYWESTGFNRKEEEE